MILPLEKLPEDTASPSKLIIFSKPKTGKTELVSQLPNNLLIDLEDGSKYVSALKYNVKREAEKNGRSPLDELKELLTEIKKTRPYKYITIDTITSLEEMVLPLALKLYNETPMGKNFKGNILSLPQGAGYLYLREAFFKVLDLIYECADHIILLGHLKSKSIDKNGTEVEAKDLDLTGKLKSMTSADVDAIGLLYRSKENINMLSFITTDDVICGARPKHLKNKEFVISEATETGIKSYWETIYID